MLARVLIVIVVVAVLGFFGTRGSEKVVEEVTTRQAVVDDHGEKLTAMEERLAKAEAMLAASEKARNDAELQAVRAIDQMSQRVATLEREMEVLRAEVRDDGQANLMITRFPSGPIAIDGKPVTLVDGETVRIKRGPHVVTLTDPASKRKQKFRINVKADGPSNRLVLGMSGQVQTDGAVEAVALK
jgi:hypothetical protein